MVDFTGGRARAANYKNICETIADSYPEGLAHGVQKDGIQNAFDARVGRSPVTVRVSLIENPKGVFLTIADSNTTGLTGPVVTNIADYEDDLPAEYHWARFESFAFTKERPDAIGARGQGKFIFLAASSEYTMFYDSLRGDGVYRLGATQATSTGCPILPGDEDVPWEGSRGAEVLADQCDLQALGEVGTRIIVVNPRPGVVEALRDGTLERAVQETWFRAIEKQQLIVELEAGAEVRKVGLPSPYPLLASDMDTAKTWVFGVDFLNDGIELSTGEGFRIKHFHAVYSKELLEPDMEGIAIIHHGMKITSIPASMFPPEARRRCTGYIEFDRELDRALRKGVNQHPNHYDLKWRRRLPQAIKQFITDQLTDFGRAKLGIGQDPRAREKARRDNSEEWAMRQLERYASDLDLFGASGRRPPPATPTNPPPTKDIGITIHRFSFPDATIAPRVNWGDKFDDLHLTAFNNLPESRDCCVVFKVLRNDAIVRTLIDRREVVLEAQSMEDLGVMSLVIDEGTFPEAGTYRLRAALYDAIRGDRIDQVTRRFWVEKDPPLRSPFDLVPVDTFPQPYEHYQWLTEGTVNNSATLYYSTSHPAYRAAEDDGTLDEYMIGVVVEGAIHFILQRPDLDDGSPDYHPLEASRILGNGIATPREDVPNTSYREIMGYVSEFRWRMYA